MHRLKHPNVINILEAIETETKMYLILEIAEKGDMLDYINTKKCLSEEDAKILFYQFTCAMEYVHKQNVVHRDLKCENILIDGKGRLRVTDFGFATSTFKARLLETFCGSYAYACPEILRGEPYNGKAADVWSMGVVLFAMLCARLPFSDEDLKAIVRQGVSAKRLKVSRKISKECKDILRQTLNTDCHRRITCAEMLEHVWLKNVPEEYPQVVPQMMENIKAEEEDAVNTEGAVPVHAKIGEPRIKMVAKLISQPLPPDAEKNRLEQRRHTVPAYQGFLDLTLQETPQKRRATLHDELLKTMVNKEFMKKMDDHRNRLIAARQEKQPEQAKPQVHSKMSTLVHDIVMAERSLKQRRQSISMACRKHSLMSDVRITAPIAPISNTGTRTPYTETEAHAQESFDQQQQRLKELNNLKRTTAGRAAQIAARERESSRKFDVKLSEPAEQNLEVVNKVAQMKLKFARMCGKSKYS